MATVEPRLLAEIFGRDVVDLISHEEDGGGDDQHRISLQLVATYPALGLGPANWKHATGEVAKTANAVDKPSLQQDLADRISRNASQPIPFEVSITSATPIPDSTAFNFIFDIGCAACGSFGLDLIADTPDETPIRCPDCGADLGNMASIKSECAKAVRERHASQQQSAT